MFASLTSHMLHAMSSASAKRTKMLVVDEADFGPLTPTTVLDIDSVIEQMSSSVARVEDLPLDLLLQVLHHCDSASQLLTMAASSKGLYALITGEAPLWGRLLQRDYPLLCTSALAATMPAARQLYRDATTGAKKPLAVQLMNPGLVPGTYGAAMYVDAAYTAPRTLECCELRRDSAPSLVPQERVRAVSGSPDFACTLSDFETTLKPGQVVELQWKKSEQSPRFNWWFALVYDVPGPDVVRLFFPQYSSSPDHDPAKLTSLAEIERTRTTFMHGGVAGGLRIPTLDEVLQWWHALLEPSTCVVDARLSRVCRGHPTGSIDGIRERFAQNLKGTHQPAKSLRMAGMSDESATHVSARLMAAQQP